MVCALLLGSSGSEGVVSWGFDQWIYIFINREGLTMIMIEGGHDRVDEGAIRDGRISRKNLNFVFERTV